MHNWKKFNEKPLPKKEDFHSLFSLKVITDVNYV